MVMMLMVVVFVMLMVVALHEKIVGEVYQLKGQNVIWWCKSPILDLYSLWHLEDENALLCDA